jgi:hypothetical protein
MEPTSATGRSSGSIATENTEDTEMEEKDERTQQIVGAAIEDHFNFGRP